MNLTINLSCILIFALISMAFVPAWSFAQETGLEDSSDEWEQGRLLFYWAVDEERFLEPAMQLFQDLSEADVEHKGRALTYLGALTALKAKHAAWPHHKLKWVNRGLTLMDQGLRLSPSDAESLFIHGATCYYLPFFFGRKADAQRNFDRLIRVLDTQMQDYDPELVRNALDFLTENAELIQELQQRVRKIENQLSALLANP